MKETELPRVSDEDFDSFYEGVGCCGNRNSYDALLTIDRLLKPHGLELLLYTGDSDYRFRVIQREPEPERQLFKRPRGPDEVQPGT